MSSISAEQSFRINPLLAFVSHPLAAWLVFFASLFLTGVAYHIADRYVQKRAAEHFEYQLGNVVYEIKRKMNLYEQILHGGVGLFQASDQVNRDEWRAYVASLQLEARVPGIQGIGYALPVDAKRIEAHEQSIRAQGFPDYQLRPKGPREVYTAIVYLEPFEWRNQRAFGFDMYSNPVRREAMQAAKETRQTHLTRMVTLVQETEVDIQKGFLLYAPLYKQVEGKEAFLGWIYAPFRADDFMAGLMRDREFGSHYRIYDSEQMTPENVLYDTRKITEQPYAAASDVVFQTQRQLDINGKTWLINMEVDENAFYFKSVQREPMVILIAGLIVDVLLAYVMLSLYFVNRHAQRLSAKLEKDFALNQKSLAWQAKLVESKEQEANAFFEMAPDAFIVTNHDGAIVRANQKAHDLFDFRQGALVGKKVEELIPKEMSLAHKKKREAYQEQPEQRPMNRMLSLEALKSNGLRFPVSVNLTPIEIDGEKHTVAAVHDMSVQKNIERTLAEAKESAESASRSKSEFVANMSHEIRTPLNAVIGSAQLLEKTNPDPTQGKYISMIRSSGEALLGVINDILDFSKIEAGCMELNYIPFDLDEVLSRVGVMMSVNVGEKDLELIIDVASDVPRQLMGDPLRLQQVLINLVSNAIKFTEKGIVCLEVQNKEGAMSLLGSHKQSLSFAVKDTGMGMDDNQRARLFKAFSQADASITRKFGGTGLGLVICSKIVKLMGGTMEVESRLSKGSTFSFCVDVEIAEEADKDAGLKIEKRILVLDDHQGTLRALSHIFEYMGWQFENYCSMDDVLKQLSVSSHNKDYDFVFVDSEFGKQNSSLFLTRLENAGVAPCPRIIMLSNNLKAANLNDQVRSDFDGSVVKPLVKTNVVQALQESYVKFHKVELFDERSTKMVLSNKLSGIEILLVEDNPLNQTVALGLLEDMGVADVVVAENGMEAIHHLSQQTRDFDVVLMDIQMPVLDGLSATRQIRQKLKLDIPIVAMTAGVLNSERQEYIDSGMNDFIAKPVDERELFSVVSRYYKSEMSERKTPLSLSQSNTPSEIKPAVISPAKSVQDMVDNGNQLVFDESRLKSLTKGKPERELRIAKSLENIIHDGPEKIQAGKLAVLDDDMAKAKFEFHSLKGVVANYGANELAESIRNLEFMIEGQTDKQVVLEQVTMIEANFARFEVKAKQWVKSLHQDNTQEEKILPIALPAGLLRSLDQATKLQDITAIEAYASEIEALGGQGKVLAEKIRNMIDELDTSGISEIVKSLNHVASK